MNSSSSSTCTIHRLPKNENFTITPNSIHNNVEISFKAKGILGYLLSKPDDWQTYISQLAGVGTDGKISVYSGIRELIKAGFINKIAIRDNKGRFVEWKYEIFEDPTINPLNTAPKPHVENPHMENIPLTSTDFFKNTDNKHVVPTMPAPPVELVAEPKNDPVVCSNINFNNENAQTLANKASKPDFNDDAHSTSVSVNHTQKKRPSVAPIKESSSKTVFDHPLLNQLKPAQRQSCSGIIKQIIDDTDESTAQWYITYALSRKPRNIGGYIRKCYNENAYGNHLANKESIEREKQALADKQRHNDDLDAMAKVVRPIIDNVSGKTDDQQRIIDENEKNENILFKIKQLGKLDLLDRFIKSSSKFNLIMKRIFKKNADFVRKNFIKDFLDSLGTELKLELSVAA